MSPQFPNPGRSTSSLPVPPENSEENPFEFHSGAQPADEDGVMDSMATLAISPSLLENLQAAEIHHAAGEFAQMDDAAIMLELRAGNMAGFDFLIQKYRKPIIHFMYRMVHNQAVAEELAQEVFLRVYRARDTYRAEARFSTWLYRIATNLGVNYARDTRHERNASTIYLDETDSETGTTPDVADSTPSAESNLLNRERLNAIRPDDPALCTNGNAWLVSCTGFEGMD